jgi:hypothetical protein
MAGKINEYTGKNGGFLQRKPGIQLFYRSDNFSLFYDVFNVPYQSVWPLSV